MQMTVTFTAESKTGNVVRITSAVKRLGFKLIKTDFQRLTDPSIDSIMLVVDADRQLANKDFSSIVAGMSQVTAVEVSGSDWTPLDVAKVPVQTPLPPVRPVAPTSTLNNDMLAPKPASAPPPSVKYMGESVRAAFVKQHGRRLVGEYPNIHRSLVALEPLVAPHAREDLLMRIGTALGHWQHKKMNSHNDRMNKTVKQSLQMQQDHFKSLPVLAGLVSIGKKKHNELVHDDPMTQLESVLSDFVQASVNGATVTVANCPHCSAERTPTLPDCYFIHGFIEGFLTGNKGFEGTIAHQRTSVSTGAVSCVFEVKKNV